jgi:hypothetical protein
MDDDTTLQYVLMKQASKQAEGGANISQSSKNAENIGLHLGE